ncbi:MAG: hypothetical protein M1813_008305 [Trichoglossum hirsutum]|nr:MAG: hypothetical protein M1813_008305 [Trichoglossum hirsutum]
MHFLKLIAATLSLASFALSAPAPDAEIDTPGFSKREVLPIAKISRYGGCNSVIQDKNGFGCEGTKLQNADGFWSISLEYSGKGDKPTAACFKDSNCEGTVAVSAGIWKGRTYGCTDFSEQLYCCQLWMGC